MPIKAKIQNNKVKLPGHHINPSNSEKDPTLTASMISKLRSANLHRTSLVKKLFENEFCWIAQSISTSSLSVYHGKKSELIKNFKTSKQIPGSKRSIVVELSAVVQAKKYMSCTTFDHFASLIYNYIVNVLCQNYERCDIVADQYLTSSLKEGTRSKRGSSGTKFNFTGSTKFPSNFENFLNNSENKSSPYQFLAQTFTLLHTGKTQILVVTYNETVLSNLDALQSDPDISHCTAEEAVPRIIRHAIN